MGFYDLTKTEREQKYKDIQSDILRGLQNGDFSVTAAYFDDTDTYIRKAAYLGVGKIHKQKLAPIETIIDIFDVLIKSDSERVRQTVINSAGEIAVSDFICVEHLFDIGIIDPHHSVKNAVQGSLKKAGEKNPAQIIPYCRRHITSPDPEARRTAAHGLELRGRTHPEDVMSTLRLLQFEKHKRVRPMLVHIFGQISYKKGCLEKVTAELLTWDDKDLADECFDEIIKQHHHIDNHFRTVETLSSQECEEYLREARNKVQN
ncbi:MAG: HEAT repeat domain-containing protein [Methanosarcinales archaeon]|jgi:vesicle coat complex subunit|nr:HEAT repeat domain-containing protein [Methanosarcinales archaeon]